MECWLYALFYFLSYYAIKNIDDTLIAFFKVMFVLSLLDLLVVICLVMVVYFKHYRILSLELLNKGTGSNFSCDDELSLKRTLRFSIQLSGLSIIWVVATQIDKFILSAYISLDEYAKVSNRSPAVQCYCNLQWATDTNFIAQVKFIVCE